MWLYRIEILLLCLAEIYTWVSSVVLCWHLGTEKLTADSAQWLSTIPVVLCLTVIVAAVTFLTSKFVIKRKAIRDFEAAHGALNEDNVRMGLLEWFKYVAVGAFFIWVMSYALIISQAIQSNKQGVDLGLTPFLCIPTLFVGVMITGSIWYMSEDAAVVYLAQLPNEAQPVAAPQNPGGLRVQPMAAPQNLGFQFQLGAAHQIQEQPMEPWRVGATS